MVKKKHNPDMDEFFRKSGFLRHKVSYRGAGYYFSVGGYDITYEDAKQLYRNHERLVNNGKLALLKAVKDKAHFLEDYYKVIEPETVQAMIDNFEKRELELSK